jgi:hypothetical protein
MHLVRRTAQARRVRFKGRMADHTMSEKCQKRTILL